jgi:hypothetical protein
VASTPGSNNLEGYTGSPGRICLTATPDSENGLAHSIVKGGIHTIRETGTIAPSHIAI